MPSRASCRTLSVVASLLGTALLAGTLRPPLAEAVSGPPGFVVEDAFPNAKFNLPVEVVFLPDGRRLVVEQGGVIWTITPSDSQLPTPFIDLSASVLSNPGSGRGLLGVAVDPDFATNRWVYLAYTVDPDSNGVDNNDEAYARLERYRASAADSNVADLSTRQVLIGTTWSTGFPCPDTYHSIGALRFAPDRTLLVASGEGAHFDGTDAGGRDSGQFLPGRANPAEDIGSFRSLTLNSLGGKILRVNKETGRGLPSNPFWDGDSSSVRSRVWIYGVRNPYRFALRPATGTTDPSIGEPGTLYIGDTGWNTYEAVHLAKSGGLSMGWPCYEGPSPQPLYQAVTSTTAGNTNVLCGSSISEENPRLPTSPLVWWNHTDGTLSNPRTWTGYACIGGVFHQGSSYPPPYAGSYFVADYVSGWIRYIQVDSLDQVVGAGGFVSTAGGPVDVEWDPTTGDLFYVSQWANQVRRIRYYVANEPKVVKVRADSASGTGPYAVPGADSPWMDPAGPHDPTLVNFAGDSTSGWQGDGTVLSPYRLGFDGVDDRVTLPGASIPELQSPSAATVALWFKTGSVTNLQYLFEWLASYSSPFPGMSIAVGFTTLRVLVHTWIDVATIYPNTWYHVALTKQSGMARVFLNGQLVYLGYSPNLGGQTSEIVLGASTYRGAGQYGEFFGGSIAQVAIWPVALSEPGVLAEYQAGQSLFLSSSPELVHVRADSARGSGPYPIPGADSPWRDRIGAHDMELKNFMGNTTSGWQGNGTIASPYRLEFDGVDDRVAIPAGGLAELQSPSPVTIALWLKTGPDVSTTQYLCEWVTQYSLPYPGMSMAIENGTFRVFLDPWVDVAPVRPNTWYYLTVAKDAGAVRAYVNETRRFSSASSNAGVPASEIVIGASTYRGAGVYGEFFRGSIAQARIWRRALLDPQVQEAFHESSSLYILSPPLWAKVVSVRADSAAGTVPYPIPGAGAPWTDLIGPHDVSLGSFAGDSASGWEGDGTFDSPFRLRFDGLDDRATIGAGSVAELQSPEAATTALWFKTASDVVSTQYLLEWVASYSAPFPGMTIAIAGGKLRVRLNSWVDVEPVQPDTWYHVAVSKEVDAVTVYVNRQIVYSGANPNLGSQASEIVLGASTYRGAGQYGEFFKGSIAQMCTWPVALDATGVRDLFLADYPLYLPAALAVPELRTRMQLAARPNPFHHAAAIEFTLARAGAVDLMIYALDGRLVRTLARGPRPAGRNSLSWDGKDERGHPVRAGVYFVRLVTPESRGVRRLVFLK